MTAFSELLNRSTAWKHHLHQRAIMVNLLDTLTTPAERKILLYLRNGSSPASLESILKSCRLKEQDARSVLAILSNKRLVKRTKDGLFTSP